MALTHDHSGAGAAGPRRSGAGIPESGWLGAAQPGPAINQTLARFTARLLAAVPRKETHV